MTGPLDVRPVGRRAVLVAAGEHQAADLAAGLAGAGGVGEVIVGAETVLVVADGPASLARILDTLETLTVDSPRMANPHHEVEVRVRYDGADLQAVAEQVGLSVAEVIELHSGSGYRAAFLGFAPGFAYLAGLPESLRVGRRSEPRGAVPAGSVAIADAYSAVYPRSTPGGWNLLGTTDAVLWDPDRRPPALLAAGTRVRFVPVDRLGATPPRDGPASPPPGATMEVVDGGPLTTIQDGGRGGHAAEGVPPSGAFDRAAAALANRLVGNAEAAAVLETTLSGPTLRLRGPAGTRRAVAVTGAAAPVTVDAAGRATNAPFDLAPDRLLVIGPATAGLRSYLAVSGGFDGPAVLGSRSTDVLSGLGPPVLEAGQMLPLGVDHGRRPGVDVAPVAARPAAVLRLGLGPRKDWLTPGGFLSLAAGAWTVAPTSNRIGVRLAGPDLSRARDGELPPEGLVTGAVQLTPSGELVVFGLDHPVTGGYPVVAVVDEGDLGLLAQLRPGDRVSFRVDR